MANGGVVLSDVFTKFFRARAPIMKKILLVGLALEPVEFHIHGSEAFAYRVVGHNTKCRFVVGLYGCGRFFFVPFI